MTTRNNNKYSNNARTTLLAGITNSAVSITVSSASGFPSVSGGSDYFNVTLDDGVHVEIIKVYGVSSNTFTSCLRGQEGTAAYGFSAGAKVEVRLTAGALTNFARITDRLADYVSVDNLPTPATFDGNSALCANGDELGVPVIGVTTGTKWRFSNYPLIARGSTAGASATTTSIVLASAQTLLPNPLARAYIIQFTSGVASGLCRVVTVNAGTLSWVTALPSAPGSSDTYEVYQGGSSLSLPLAGGTMTGNIVLAGDGASALNPTSKQQLDAVSAVASAALSKAGGTMTGNVVLAGDGSSALHPASKQQLDAVANASVPKAGGTMTGLLTLSGDAIAALGAVTKQQLVAATTTGGLTANNSITLASGHIIKYGSQYIGDPAAGNQSYAHVFPVAFPNACFLVVPCIRDQNADNCWLSYKDPSVTGFTWQVNEATASVQNITLGYIAIGY